MKKITLFFFCFVCITTSAQTWEWARKADATTSGEVPRKILTDSLGNSYFRGYCNGCQYGSTTIGSSQFVTKFNSSGGVVWAMPIDQNPIDFKVDKDGNSYFFGSYTGTQNIFSYTFTSNGSVDLYPVKLDAAGSPLWGRSFGGVGGENPGKIGIDQDLNVYLTGNFKTAISFDAYTLIDSTTQFFLAKLDASGNTVWATAADPSFAIGDLIVPDKHSNLYLVGFNDSYGWFVAKFDNAGNLLFHTVLFGMYDYVPTMAVGEFGNVFLLHNGIGHYGFLPILVKYDSLMNQQWSRTIGTHYGCYQYEAEISLDGAENIYVGGTLGGGYCFQDSVYFFGQLAYVGDLSVPSVAKFSTSGNLLWTKAAESSNLDAIYTMSMDSDGNLVVAGIFNWAYTINDHIVFDSYALDNDGAFQQSFVAKLNPSALATSFPQISSVDQIQIFPNPSSGIFTLLVNNSNAKVCVRDVMGRCILQKECRNEASDIDLSAEGKGIYFLEVMAEDKSVVKKIVIQ